MHSVVFRLPVSITCKHWVPCVGETDPRWRRNKAVEFVHNPLSSIVYLVHPAIILHIQQITEDTEIRRVAWLERTWDCGREGRGECASESARVRGSKRGKVRRREKGRM